MSWMKRDCRDDLYRCLDLHTDKTTLTPDKKPNDVQVKIEIAQVKKLMATVLLANLCLCRCL